MQPDAVRSYLLFHRIRLQPVHSVLSPYLFPEEVNIRVWSDVLTGLQNK